MSSEHPISNYATTCISAYRLTQLEELVNSLDQGYVFDVPEMLQQLFNMEENPCRGVNYWYGNVELKKYKTISWKFGSLSSGSVIYGTQCVCVDVRLFTPAKHWAGRAIFSGESARASTPFLQLSLHNDVLHGASPFISKAIHTHLDTSSIIKLKTDASNRWDGPALYLDGAPTDPAAAEDCEDPNQI